MYRGARNSADKTIEEAAFALHIAPRTLCKYESGESQPPPEVALAMSRVYGVPRLTQVYCRQNCAIGQAYSYEVLNRVSLDLPSVMQKLIGELREAQDLLCRMLEITVNKKRREDFTPAEWAEFMIILQEFLDVEHNIETLKISLGAWCDVSELVAAHNQKCWQKGYVVKEKPLYGAARK